METSTLKKAGIVTSWALADQVCLLMVGIWSYEAYTNRLQDSPERKKKKTYHR